MNFEAPGRGVDRIGTCRKLIFLGEVSAELNKIEYGQMTSKWIERFNEKVSWRSSSNRPRDASLSPFFADISHLNVYGNLKCRTSSRDAKIARDLTWITIKTSMKIIKFPQYWIKKMEFTYCFETISRLMVASTCRANFRSFRFFFVSPFSSSPSCTLSLIPSTLPMVHKSCWKCTKK